MAHTSGKPAYTSFPWGLGTRHVWTTHLLPIAYSFFGGGARLSIFVDCCWVCLSFLLVRNILNTLRFSAVGFRLSLLLYDVFKMTFKRKSYGSGCLHLTEAERLQVRIQGQSRKITAQGQGEEKLPPSFNNYCAPLSEETPGCTVTPHTLACRENFKRHHL